ncbi:hypothetical protein MAR_021811 [Mya arenaria]|uniref:Uncharacterized protein n=1 Tax=Mya arenaria TaxID=6604 RepID=A0ABY7E8V7_MYAAR|nr:hypothetical protein MAR_021811 [Mya arenaria]
MYALLPCTDGHTHEENAITAYKQFMKSKGNNVVVEKRGLVVCKDYGASVDGIVNDLTTDTSGCLEDSSGQILLNRAHDYYIQIQGQMYVLGLSWADFVVWLSDEHVHVERVAFDIDAWTKNILPALKHFFETAFVPELLTRKVKCGMAPAIRTPYVAS